MAVRSKSASVNQTFLLASKAFVIALAQYWMRSGGFGFWATTVFIAVLIVFYIRPSLNVGRFFPSLVAISIFPFLIPRAPGTLEILFVSGWGALLFLLLGVKSLVIIRRQEVYRFIHFILIAALSIIFFANFGFGVQILMFVTFLFLFREFYLMLTPTEMHQSILLATVESFLLVQTAWIITFLSVGFLAGAALLMLLTFASHDIALHYLRRTLSRELLLRNTGVFIVLTALVFIFLR